MNILAIETSCDETSAAIVRDGRQVLSSIIASQIDIHQKYGGVVPEVASRQHILYITPVLNETLEAAGLGWDEIDAVAVTNGPGLAGALLVGVNVGKAIAFARQKPLIGINHLESHIYANWLVPIETEVRPAPEFPLVCLVVSGGHTEIVLIEGHGDYRLLGKTQDDAAGEAFDKVARVMGLGYPGGPLVEKAALEGDPQKFPFTRSWLKGTYDFSFSGLKTAVLRKVEEYQAAPPRPAPFSGTISENPPMLTTPKKTQTPQPPRPLSIKRAQDPWEDAPASANPESVAPEPEPQAVVSKLPVADIAASFQAAVVEMLATKVVQAAEEYSAKQILVAGGVAANKALRGAIAERAARLDLHFSYPSPVFCTDNAAMVAAAAYFRLTNPENGDLSSDWELDIRPGWELVG